MSKDNPKTLLSCSYGYVSAVDPEGAQSGLRTRIATMESVSLREDVLEGEKQASAGFPTEAFVVSVIYLVWNMRNSANSVELLIFVTNHGSGPILVVTCS